MNKIIIFVMTIGILLQFASLSAMAGEQNVNLPLGPNLGDIPWAYVPGADPFHLLSYNDEARKELGVTQEQLKKLLEMEPLFRSQLRELSYRPESSGAREAISRHMEVARNGLGRILTPVQLERLQQLLLWIQGPCSAPKDDRLLSRLQLTDGQVDQMDTVCHELSDKILEIHTTTQINGNGKPCSSCEIYSKIQQSLQIANKKVFALFSEEQMEIYTEIAGKPFTFNSEKVLDCP